jgi:AAA domain
MTVGVTDRLARRDRYTTTIPVALQALPQWVLWRGESRVHQQTGQVTGLTKIPINPQTLRKASTTDPATWGTFQHCCRVVQCTLEQWGAENPQIDPDGGLGFVFTAQDPYIGIDLDHCRNPATGVLELWAQQIVNALASYAEVSPSGQGVHLYVKGRLSGKGHKCSPIELYDRERYFTITDDPLPGTPTTIENRQAVIEGLYVAMPIIAKLLADQGRREKFERLFTGDTSGYNSPSEADLAFCNMLVVGGARTEAECLAAIRLSRLYDEKWDRDDYQERTIGKALAGKSTAAPSAKRLQVQSARCLVEKDLPAVRWIVRDLIPEGVTLLAGDAKIGKSWAALGMALAVATGTRVFSHFETVGSDVLYLALEDGDQRMQDRLDTLLRANEPPANLYIVYDCSPMPLLVEELQGWKADHPQTGIVIVDVLAKVRQGVGGIQNAYLKDYKDLTPLQRFALDAHIGVVMVTHTNQRDMWADILHAVSGTTGVVGCADTILLLQRARNAPHGQLHVTGRDVTEGVFEMAFHSGVWVCKGAHANTQPGPEPTARARAEALLRTMLADGPKLTTDLDEAAKAQGIAERTLNRARKGLGVVAERVGERWICRLP